MQCMHGSNNGTWCELQSMAISSKLNKDFPTKSWWTSICQIWVQTNFKGCIFLFQKLKLQVCKVEKDYHGSRIRIAYVMNSHNMQANLHISKLDNALLSAYSKSITMHHCFATALFVFFLIRALLALGVLFLVACCSILIRSILELTKAEVPQDVREQSFHCLSSKVHHFQGKSNIIIYRQPITTKTQNSKLCFTTIKP